MNKDRAKLVYLVIRYSQSESVSVEYVFSNYKDAREKAVKIFGNESSYGPDQVIIEVMEVDGFDRQVLFIKTRTNIDGEYQSNLREYAQKA